MAKASLLLLIGTIVSIGWAAQGRALPDDIALQYVDMTQANFWGRAVGSDGNPIELPPGQDPDAAIIQQEDALDVVNAAVPLGMAKACGLRTDRQYLAYMRSQRENTDWTEVQIAFIGMLFGVSTQGVAKMFEGTCTPEIRQKIQDRINRP